jgi:hypothetical protein
MVTCSLVATLEVIAPLQDGNCCEFQAAILLVHLHKVPPPKESMKPLVKNRCLKKSIPGTARIRHIPSVTLNDSSGNQGVTAGVGNLGGWLRGAFRGFALAKTSLPLEVLQTGGPSELSGNVCRKAIRYIKPAPGSSRPFHAQGLAALDAPSAGKVGLTYLSFFQSVAVEVALDVRRPGTASVCRFSDSCSVCVLRQREGACSCAWP